MKKYYFIAGLLILGFLIGKSSSPSSNTAGVSTEKVQPTTRIIEISPTQAPTVTLQPTSIPTVYNTPTSIPPTQYIAPTTAQTNSGLSNDNYYTNVSGNQVHSPAYSDTVPQGATARCGDGTYSFSQHRQGTCSHHGGVAEWL